MTNDQWDAYVAGRDPNSLGDPQLTLFERVRDEEHVIERVAVGVNESWHCKTCGLWFSTYLDASTHSNPPLDRRAVCPMCNEDIEPMHGDTSGTPLWVDGLPRKTHVQCMLREVVGGIGHLIAHDYWCGAPRHDPDAGLTYRQSAQLVATWVKVVGIENDKETEDNGE